MARMSDRHDRQDKHDDFDIPSIVPERDELVSHRQRPRGTSVSAPVADDHVVVRGGTSGGVIFMLSLLFLGMVATGGAAYLFYTQGQDALAQLRNAEGRIAALESTLSAVGQDTEQTTLGLLQRIETNFSEIDKLWAARNTLRTDVAALKTASESQGELLSSLESAVTNQASTLNNVNAALGTVRARVDTISSNLNGLEDASRQIAALNAELDQLEATLANMTPRLNATEQDIESINVYRLQLNQTITAMQENIRQLQQRIGQ